MQQSKLQHGVQVLIATPGRLIDFIYSRSIDLTHVETLILDEADEMLSLGFHDDLEFIIQCLVHKHQTLLFSATMPDAIRRIAKLHMKSPQEVVLTSTNATPRSIDHQFLYCQHHQRDVQLAHIIEKLQPKQAIIFCHSRIQCEKVCGTLQRSGGNADFLHAGLGQDTRTTITNKFRTGKIRFLVATDIAARGLDFSGVTHVFIYQLSDDPDIYVHRSGRTGRHDRKGMVITLVTEREVATLHHVLKLIKQEPVWVEPPPEHWNKPSKKSPSHPRRTYKSKGS
jgi:ATP-dependent RNA helicase DeaD